VPQNSSGETISTQETGGDEGRSELHNDILRSMKSSRAIGYVNMELVSDVSETLSTSIIRA
jgi:hypothetical protein